MNLNLLSCLNLPKCCSLLAQVRSFILSAGIVSGGFYAAIEFCLVSHGDSAGNLSVRALILPYIHTFALHRDSFEA